MSDEASLPPTMALQCSETSVPTGAFTDPPHMHLTFPTGSVVKNLPANAGDKV